LRPVAPNSSGVEPDDERSVSRRYSERVPGAACHRGIDAGIICRFPPTTGKTHVFSSAIGAGEVIIAGRSHRTMTPPARSMLPEIAMKRIET